MPTKEITELEKKVDDTPEDDPSEMTLEEINTEIYAARREREAREAQTRKENESC